MRRRHIWMTPIVEQNGETIALPCLIAAGAATLPPHFIPRATGNPV